MKSTDFTNEHALMIDPEKGTTIFHDDLVLRKFVTALKNMGKSREEIIKQIQRAKQLTSMGGRKQDKPETDTYSGVEKRKPRLPYYSYTAEGEDSKECPKCKGKISHGKDGNKPVKVCVPCRKIYPSDQVKESTPFPTKDALAVGFPDVQVGDTIRTRKMSLVGVVTKVVPNDPKRAWTSDAVYFEVEGSPRRICVTPLSNVTIIRKSMQEGKVPVMLPPKAKKKPNPNAMPTRRGEFVGTPPVTDYWNDDELYVLRGNRYPRKK